MGNENLLAEYGFENPVWLLCLEKVKRELQGLGLWLSEWGKGVD
jgi:hypothetical protein